MQFRGTLTSKDQGYAGHSAELVLNYKIDEVAAPVPLRLIAEIMDDGSFEVDLPETDNPLENAELSIRAPDGSRLDRREVTISRARARIPVAPKLPIRVRQNRDPLDPSLGPFEVSVHVIDTITNGPAKERVVALWGKLADAPADAPERTILAAEYSDATGVAHLSFDRQKYAFLEVELAGALQGPVRRDVRLDDDAVPQDELRLSAAFEEDDTGDTHDHDGEHEDCHCEVEAPPRAPDHAALTTPDSPFSADLANGTCPSPAVPNRTLEDHRFFSLVRTTDPYLFGVKPKPGLPLVPEALNALAGLAYGFDTMDHNLTPAGEGMAASRDATSKSTSVDEARLASSAYVSSGLLAARAWRETASPDDVRKEIFARAEGLSEDVLRHALADPDGFTPVSLMTAERLSAVENVSHRLAFLYDRSKGRELIEAENMPDWDSKRLKYQASTVAHGHILEWRQMWQADGYSLGDLLYSLPLAPGQKRKIAVVDWDRREGAYRSETRSFIEEFDADLTRNRTVNEVVNSTVSESIDAGSSANTWAAGGGLGLGIPFKGGFFGLGVAGGGGGASSNAWQNSTRSLGASSGQQLLDRTNQAASAVRSQKATVVVGEQQNEGLSITSEIVANYNHCHALTMEYFEVLQHFKVTQDLANVRECLFIPLQMKPFNVFRALRWRDILQPRLRRRRLSRGFGAIERVLQGYADSDLPPGRYADELVRDMNGELRLELNIARPRDAREDEDIDAYLDSTWHFWTDLFGLNSAKAAYDATIADRDVAERIFADEYAPRVARAFCDSLKAKLVVDIGGGNTEDKDLEADFTMVSDYRPGGQHLVTFRATRIPANISRDEILGIRFESDLDDLSPNSRTVLRMVNVSYSNDYRKHQLVRRRWVNNDILNNDPALFPTRNLSRSEERNPRADDKKAISELLKHLNEFVEYYHQIIWWGMDPNRRFMLLDGFVAPGSGGRSLASVVENRLVNILGNALVMPVAPGYQLDPLTRNADEDEELDLLALYKPPVPLPARRFSLPTRGVHAEAVLGACNSCDIRDDTRFWDWASEEIPGNNPPEIQEISTQTRRQDPADVTPTDLPAPVVAIQNAPAAPDPTSLADVANLLSKEGLFKDVTGLEGNQLNAIESFKQSLKTANAFGKLAASGAKASFANRNSERVMRKLDEAESSGLIDKADAQEVSRKLFGVINGETGETDTPLNGDPMVQDVLQKVLKDGSGKTKVSATSESGSSSQSIETSFNANQVNPEVELSYRILGVPPLQQPSPETCWAVGLTMLISHKRQQSLPVETALLQGGQDYVDLFRAGAPLPINRVEQFRADFDLVDPGIGALSAHAIEDALKRYGPLWVIGDEDSGAGFSIHARVVTGVTGDATPTGTRLIFNDPANGTTGAESLKVFAEKIAQLSGGMTSAFGGVSPTILAVKP